MKAIVGLLLTVSLFSSTRSSSDSEFKHVQIDCSIYGFDGKIVRSYNASMCIFLEDGSRIELHESSQEGQGGEIRYISSNNDLKWNHEDQPHHELQLTRDKKWIFYLGREYGVLDGKKIRFDTINVLNLNGEQVVTWSLKENFAFLEKILKEHRKALHPIMNPHNLPAKAFEFTHFNSVKEIPHNKLYPQLKYLKPGNFILGANCMGVFIIFNPHFNKIEKILNSDQRNDCNTHDAQVLPNGNILHYSNFESGERDDIHTLIKEINPANGFIEWKWPNFQNPYHFSNIVLGSVDRMKNNYTVFTDNGIPLMDFQRVKDPTVLVVSPLGRIAYKWKFVLSQGENIYRTRILNLDKFLENSL